MEPMLLLALLGASGLFLLMDDDDSEDTENQEQGGEEQETGEQVTISESGEYVTTNGDDSVVIAEGGVDGISLVTGDGDDSVNSINQNEALDVESSSISTGAGNDSVDVDGVGVTILGGSGDDFISLTGGFGEGNTARGEDGDDTLSGDANISLFGGSGDDVIELLGSGSSDANFFNRAFGGEGDDTLILNNPLDEAFDMFDSQGDGGAVATGGGGDDTFEIVVDVAESFQEALEEDGWDFGETINYRGFSIMDFTPGDDQIEVNASSEWENSVLTSATLRTDNLELVEPGSTGGFLYSEDVPVNTVLTLVYETPDQPNVEISIGIETSSPVTFDDITFIGDQPLQIG